MRSQHGASIMTLDERGAVVEWSGEAERMFGRSRADALGCAVFDLLAAAPQELTVVPSPRRGRACYDVVAAGAQRAEEELRHRLRDAEHLASLGRVAASVSHEFNNVLMGIQPFVDLIDRFAPDERCRKAATQIRLSVRRGRQITDEVRVFTRAGAAPALRDVALETFVAAIAEQITSVLRENVELRVTCAAPELSVLCDPDQITQAVMNLCLNAQEAMPTGGRLSITARRAEEPRFVELVVSDSGCGIDEATLGRIFEPLYTTKRQGTGLGLPIVRQIVERHGGSVNVRSEVERGTEFRLLLPEGAALPEEEAARPDVPSEVRGARILLVEDDVAVATGIAEMLSAYGMQVHVIYTGTNALKAALLFSPDLLILDINLPDRSGIVVYKEIRQELPELPVIFSTGHGEESLIHGIRKDRNAGFLRKPYEAGVLLSEIERLGKARATAPARPS